MPTLTVDLTELDITVTPEARGWVEAVDSLGHPLPVVATAGTGLAFAARALEFSVGGVATIDLPSTDELDPDGARYRVYLTRADAVTVPVAVGPFAFTASAGLHEVAELPPADVVSALNALLDGAEASLGMIRDQAVLARDAARDAADDAATNAASGVADQVAPLITQAIAARDDAEAARAYVEGIVITDLGTTDGQTKALIESPTSETAGALNAAIAASPAGRRDPAGEALAATLETGVGVKTLVILGDSTGNDIGTWADWPERAVQGIIDRWPAIHCERAVWADATKSYPTPTVLSAGDDYTPATAGGVTAVLTDTFTRTAASISGSTPDAGPAWAGSNFSIDGTKAVRGATPSAAMTSGVLPSGDSTATFSDVTLSTAAGTAGNCSFTFRGDGTNWLEVRLIVGADGAISWAIVKVAGSSTVLKTGALAAVAANTADQTFTLTITSVGKVVTGTIGGSTITHTLSDEDHALLAGNRVGIIPAQRFAGMSVAGVSVAVDLPATPPLGFGLLVWNGSHPGSTLAYQTTWLEDMVPEDADVVVVNSCHNYALTSPADYIATVKAFVTAVKARAPKAHIVVTSQNPEFPGVWTEAQNRAHRDRLAALRVTAAEEGWGYIPAYEAFWAQPDHGYSLVIQSPTDGIHPLPAGSTLWAQTFLRWLARHLYQ